MVLNLKFSNFLEFSNLQPTPPCMFITMYGSYTWIRMYVQFQPATNKQSNWTRSLVVEPDVRPYSQILHYYYKETL